MKTKTLTMLILAFVVSGFANQSIAQLTGQQIMEKVYNNPSGDDTQGNLAMTLTNNRGEQRVRSLKQYIKDDGKVEKKIMYFLSPADVRNTSFMNWSYSDGRNDDQWIYLPALKRTRRISSDSKSDYFMGSDFTYDDLGDRHPNQDNHKLLREETIDGKSCYVVESTPKEEGYMYSKTITWVMKDNYLGLKREFYDDRARLLKVLTIKEFAKIDGFWTIQETEMHNVQRDHKTTMKFTDVQKNKGIPDSRFTERSMTLGS
ncbi:MAG: outer membrane lipoprotein-sorting protein [Bacteroidales bacterium]|jgi:outer membrane lipoprotein-sorting protein|nr:outer membrane lipoprotein-sorting protein [Bacteroidales bacterium]MDD4384005.1 outer membrane lipoprotein-sorting protein [Bacteroidales bacterium]MDY0198096.1 outer membrane lipoprotein-sorting protein [Tenuifilaceae bacterium]